MNRRHRTIAMLAVAASLALGGALVARHRAALPGHAWLGGEESRKLRFSVDLPRGTEYVYDVAWRQTSDLHVPELAGGKGAADGAVHADADLAGELSLRSYGKIDGAYVVGARLANVTRHHLAIFGSEALPDDDAARAAFDGREALVEIDPAGTVRALHFAKDDPPVWKQVVRTLLTDASVHVLADGESSWSSTELSSIGRAAARYEVIDTSPPRLARTRAAYSAIASLPGRPLGPGDQAGTSTATLELDARGFVRSLDVHETVRVANADRRATTDYACETTLSLALSDVRAWTPPGTLDLASLETRVPGEVVRSPEAERQMLEQRVAGLTLPQMRSDLATFALTGAFPGGQAWLMRASGLLKLHPEACLDLAALFEDPKMNARGRTQIMDLLAGTGTPKAQEAMRVALDSPEARADGSSYAALVQRFSSVARPDRDSVGYVARSYADAPKGNDRWAAAYALGAVAGNARAGGDVGQARAASDTLRRDLEGARTGAERKNLCTALGNAGDPDDASTFARLATDRDPGVRAAAAWALHKIDTPEARQASLTFAADADATVAKNAFDAMRHETLGREDLSRLADEVTSGETPASADASLLTLLAAHRDGGAPVRAMLTAVLARENANNTMAAQVRHLLAQVE